MTHLPALTVVPRGLRVLLVPARTPQAQPLFEALPYPQIGSTTMFAAQFALRVNKAEELVDAARGVLRAYAKNPHKLADVSPDLRQWLTRLHEVVKEIDPVK